MKTMKKVKNTWIVVMTFLIAWSCAPLQDPVTLRETQETKQATLTLIEKGDTPFSQNEEAVSALKTRMENIETREKNKKRNEITAKMWELLSSDEHLVGSYLKLWEEKGTLSTMFIEQATPQIEEAFDMMLLYETKKDKQNKNALTEFISNLTN